MSGIDPSLLENVLRAAGYAEAADVLAREVGGGQEDEGAALREKVARVEERLGELADQPDSPEARARADGQTMLDRMREAHIGPYGWHDPGGPPDAA